jgi:peptidoglycan-associated lipoprotein
LAILGVTAGQMEAVSFGKEKPVVVGAEEAAFAKNRRAEIRYP